MAYEIDDLTGPPISVKRWMNKDVSSYAMGFAPCNLCGILTVIAYGKNKHNTCYLFRNTRRNTNNCNLGMLVHHSYVFIFQTLTNQSNQH